MSSHPAPISSAATPKIQFAQHLDGGLHLFKFSLDIEVNLLRKIDIIHSIVQPTPNITQQHYGSIAVALGQRFAPVDIFQLPQKLSADFKCNKMDDQG